MNRSPNKLIPEDFTAIPSLERSREVKVTAVSELDEASLGAIGVVVTTDGHLPEGLDLDRAALERAGFEGKPGSTLVLPYGSGPLLAGRRRRSRRRADGVGPARCRRSVHPGHCEVRAHRPARAGHRRRRRGRGRPGPRRGRPARPVSVRRPQARAERRAAHPGRTADRRRRCRQSLGGCEDRCDHGACGEPRPRPRELAARAPDRHRDGRHGHALGARFGFDVRGVRQAAAASSSAAAACSASTPAAPSRRG